MNVETFRASVPTTTRQQSERLQVAGFVQAFADKLGIKDIAFCKPDPPDFLITLDDGMRIGIEVKRLRFSLRPFSADISAFKAACMRRKESAPFYNWPSTTYGAILSHLRAQLEKAAEAASTARNNHSVDQLWLFFCAPPGNPVAWILEALSCYNASNPASVNDGFCRFIYEAKIICEGTFGFDAVLLNGGLFTFAARNGSGYPHLSIPDPILARGRTVDAAFLDHRIQVNSSLSHSLEWS